MLIFYLIGINMVDLCGLKRLRNGRVEYRRSKTGTLFSIKVEPEAMAIMEKYKGKDFLVDIMDGRKDYNSYVKKINKVLKAIGPVEYVKEERGKTRITSRMIAHREPLFPELSTYWARHTWASLAAELEIPKETISAALGHSSGSVTDIYINFNRKKIDEANRKVLDYVKKGAEK
jgi:integrase